MVKANVLVPILVGVLGIAAFLACWYGWNNFEYTPKPPTISGGEVVDLTRCSLGYANGTCPAVAFNWSGSLVSTRGGPGSGLSNAWGLLVGDSQSVTPTTCGLHATYKTNLPTAQSKATYLPVGSGVSGMVLSGSVVYVFTDSIYTGADGCDVNSIATFAHQPLKVTVTYSLSGAQNVFSGAAYTYDYFPNNADTAGILLSLFAVGAGWALFVTVGAPSAPAPGFPAGPEMPKTEQTP